MLLTENGSKLRQPAIGKVRSPSSSEEGREGSATVVHFGKELKLISNLKPQRSLPGSQGLHDRTSVHNCCMLPFDQLDLGPYLWLLSVGTISCAPPMLYPREEICLVIVS